MEYFDTACYLFETLERNHQNAKEKCNDSGLHLVYINSNEEQFYLTERCRNMSEGIDYWIGLTKIGGNITWMDGTVLPYTNWDSGSFNDNSSCIRLASYYDYKWHDWNCYRQFAYICEKEFQNQSGILIKITHSELFFP